MIREGFPEFKIVIGVDFGNPYIDSMVVGLTCSRCEQTHFIFWDRWVDDEGLDPSTGTRPCPYCFKASKIPIKEDDMETDPKQEFMEEPSSEERGFTEAEETVEDPGTGEPPDPPSPQEDPGDGSSDD